MGKHPHIIRLDRASGHREIVANHWIRVAEAGDDAVPGHTLLPLKQWLERRDELLERDDVGIWFAPDDEPEALGADAVRLAIIAVDFPAFTDGRGFSIGRLLRERYGFTGELRAVGDVFKDTLNYLRRCGFDAFEIRADKDVEEAAKGLDDFDDAYQNSVDQPAPLFRRR
ncbi:DUF934 domain-containing protein [Parachitinimonas caeni]|uniref:DUF934 domain-containing protein n=1 Tax=Parachitinimonas caeni TaxID=3031301 RepID=A0ABT7E1B6_9NEIS|nr:DUF934 domain-containing protein [Parachitinimonas caeni]MDK2126091.1 DUF934 domain-containing protein [Parachitinimonas caeni]